MCISKVLTIVSHPLEMMISYHHEVIEALILTNRMLLLECEVRV